MLGDLIYQHTGKVTSLRILDTEKSKMEATIIASGKLKILEMSILLLLMVYSKSR
jgi:hypothetical protein